MKLGLVRFLNARPLDQGFRDAAANNGTELLEATPAHLFEALKAGRLDAALISSVEVLRHPELFDSCRSVGVCAERTVESIVYLVPRDSAEMVPKRILTDSGSRSSVALLRVLMARDFPNSNAEFVSCDPQQILSGLNAGEAGLLIGDSALSFRLSGNPQNLVVRDLAQWWFEQEQLPFVFALWAYPKNRPIADDVFEQSLAHGEKQIAAIAAHSEYPRAATYLSEVLHYRLTNRDQQGLERFRARLLDLDLL